jgi:pilus assembly protein CpaF
MSSSRRSDGANLHFRSPTELITFANEINHELSDAPDGNLRAQVIEALKAQGLRADENTLASIVQVIVERRSGMGPLTDLLADETVTDIAINGFDDVWAMRDGDVGWTKVNINFGSPAELDNLIRRVVSAGHRSIDVSNPSTDGRLGDGPRFHAAISPLVHRSPVLTIRKYRHAHFSLADLASGERRSLSRDMALFLTFAVDARLNILVAGGTGSGKTTLLSSLIVLVPAGERMVLIEDTPELAPLPEQNVVPLEADADVPNRTPDDALRDALRMAPDRLIIGEVRGPEAMTMLQAMNTGHEGSMSSIHANSPDDAIARLATLARMAGTLPYDAIRGQIGAAFHLLIQLRRDYHDGRRYISEIAEVVWDGGERLSAKPIFAVRNGRFTAIERPTFWEAMMATRWPATVPDPWAPPKRSGS